MHKTIEKNTTYFLFSISIHHMLKNQARGKKKGSLKGYFLENYLEELKALNILIREKFPFISVQRKDFTLLKFCAFSTQFIIVKFYLGR